MRSRVKELKRLQTKFEHDLKWKPESIECENLVKLILDVAINNPALESDPEFLAERHHATLSAMYLLDIAPLYLHKHDHLRSIYQVVKNPIALSSAIAQSFYEDDKRELGDPDTKAMGIEALAEGGILHYKQMRDKDIFSTRNLASLDSKKTAKLLTNLFNNDWAQEPDAEDSFWYGASILSLIAAVAENYPQYAARLVIDNAYEISRYFYSGHADFEKNGLDRNTYEENAFHGVMSSAISTKLLAGLSSVDYKLYQDFLSLPKTTHMLAGKFLSEPDFGIRNLHPHPMVDKELLIGMFVSAASCGQMNSQKADDLQAYWSKAGGRVNLEQAASKTKLLQTIIKNYRELLDQVVEMEVIRARSLNDLLDHGGISGLSDGYLYADSLVSPKGKRVCEDERLLNAHNVLLVAANDGRLPGEQVSKMKMTKELFEAFSTLPRLENLISTHTEVREKLTEAFTIPEQQVAVRGLTHAQMLSFKKMIPALTDDVLRKIDWKDAGIKAKFLDDALGL